MVSCLSFSRLFSHEVAVAFVWLLRIRVLARAGVADRVTFRVQDISDIQPATVVTLFHLSS